MIKIITLGFNDQIQGFDDEILAHFLAGKTVKSMKPEFYQQNGQAYWSIWIEYDVVLADHEKQSNRTSVRQHALNPLQQQLLKSLQQWRREKADADGIPVFIIATNKELETIALNGPRTLEALRMVHGFGRKKTERHGKSILEQVARFCKPQSDDSPATAEKKQPDDDGQ